MPKKCEWPSINEIFSPAHQASSQVLKWPFRRQFPISSITIVV